MCRTINALRKGRKKRRSSVAFTEEQLTAIRGGLTAEEYRWKLIREWGEE